MAKSDLMIKVEVENKFLELQALMTEREGYIAENQQRVRRNQFPAYCADHFFELAEKIRALKVVEDET